MRMIRVDLEDDIKERWQKLAETHGRVPEDEMRDAIIQRLEELEDHYVVQSRLAQPSDAVSNEEAWRRLDGGRGTAPDPKET